MWLFFSSLPQFPKQNSCFQPLVCFFLSRKWPQTSAILLKAKTPLCQTLPLTHQQVLPSLALKQVLNLFPFHCSYSLPPPSHHLREAVKELLWEATSLCICQWLGIQKIADGPLPWSGAWGRCTGTHWGPWHLSISTRDCTLSRRK